MTRAFPTCGASARSRRSICASPTAAIWRRSARRFYDFFLARGLLLRPLGNTIYVLPPYCVEASELDAI